MAAQWSELRRELLELILKKLDLADHARFASVCPWWRSVAVENPPINKPLYLALSHKPKHLLRRFITSFIPSWRNARFIGAGLDGWVVIVIDGRDLFLLNKAFNSIIPLPPPPLKYPFLWKAVLSSPPPSSSSSSSGESSIIVVMQLSAGVFYYRLGSENSFTELSNIPPLLEDILFYKEQLYVLCGSNTIVIFDRLLNKTSQLTHSNPAPRRLLILGNDALSMVAGFPAEYSVFTMEGSSEPRLVRVNNIDDNFLLVVNRYCSLSITTKEHKEFRRAKADDPWPLFLDMFIFNGIKNEGSRKKKKRKKHIHWF